MSHRIYQVTFEMFDEGRWIRNSFTRNVAVIGGAEQAIKVANERERKEQAKGTPRFRVEAVELIAEET